MLEWHVTPDYIVNNWTHELLDLMTTKMADRKERIREASQRPHSDAREVSATEMFNQIGAKVVKS